MRIAIYTLGCKVNQYETQAMEKILTAQGHTLVPFDTAADAYIVNTCSVTAVSDKKSRQMIRRCKKVNPDAVVAGCGCYVQTHAEEAKKLGIELVAGTAGRMTFLDLLEQAYAERKQLTLLDDALKRKEFEVLPAGGMATRTRAMLKVEDGCQNFCTYCIIPFARGPIRSLPIDVAVEQTEKLRQEGYREIVVTGIEISSYGRDFGDGTTLIDLLEKLSAAAGEMRIRLGSLEPRTITEDFCQRAAKLKNICPHFHLSMQSGCDETLKRMNRRYDTARFYESVRLLHAYFDGVAVTTDLITGFPGETEEEFGQTLDFIRKCGFAAMHVFPYSVRSGTKAAEMEQLTAAVKEERAARASAMAQEMHKAYLESCVGKVFPVLFEQTDEQGRYCGHAPNYMNVAVNAADLHNQVIDVEITGIDGDILIGRLT